MTGNTKTNSLLKEIMDKVAEYRNDTSPVIDKTASEDVLPGNPLEYAKMLKDAATKLTDEEPVNVSQKVADIVPPAQEIPPTQEVPTVTEKVADDASVPQLPNEEGAPGACPNINTDQVAEATRFFSQHFIDSVAGNTLNTIQKQALFGYSIENKKDEEEENQQIFREGVLAGVQYAATAIGEQLAQDQGFAQQGGTQDGR